jgi:serine/threonine protein kinase HipA of HipAB toxin-antitoxin module
VRQPLPLRTLRSYLKVNPGPKWQQQLEAVDQLPKSQQKFVAQMLDVLIAQVQKQIKQHRHGAGVGSNKKSTRFVYYFSS